MVLKRFYLYAIVVGLVGLLIALSIPAFLTNMTDITAKKNLFASTVDPAPELSNTSPRSDYFAILAAVKAREPEVALSSIQALPPERQGDPLVQNQLAEIWFTSGQPEKAAQIWATIGNYIRIQLLARQALMAGEYQQSIILNRELYRVRPDLVWIDLATAYQRIGDYDNAESVLIYLLDSRHNLSDYDSVNWRLKLASCYNAQKKWIESAALYRQILTEYPDNIEVCLNLGQALVLTSGLDSGVETIKQCIAIDAARADGYEKLGDILSNNKNYTEAETWYSQAAQRFIGDSSFWRHRAENAFNASNYDSAINYYQESLSVALNDIEKVDALRGLAVLFLTTKDIPRAKNTIQGALSLDARNVSSLMLAGQIYERGGDVQSAIDDYQKALALDPANPQAADAISRLKLEPGK